MKLQFKEQRFQIEAVKAVVDCFEGQPLKTNRFTLERSKEIIRKAKQFAIGSKELFETEVLEDIGYRNSSIQLLQSQSHHSSIIPAVHKILRTLHRIVESV